MKKIEPVKTHADVLKEVQLRITQRQVGNCGLSTILFKIVAHTLPYLSLLLKSFQHFDTLFNQIKSQRVQRFVGDLSANGNGEILIIQ